MVVVEHDRRRIAQVQGLWAHVPHPPAGHGHRCWLGSTVGRPRHWRVGGTGRGPQAVTSEATIGATPETTIPGRVMTVNGRMAEPADTPRLEDGTGSLSICGEAGKLFEVSDPTGFFIRILNSFRVCDGYRHLLLHSWRLEFFELLLGTDRETYRCYRGLASRSKTVSEPSAEMANWSAGGSVSNSVAQPWTSVSMLVEPKTLTVAGVGRRCREDKDRSCSGCARTSWNRQVVLLGLFAQRSSRCENAACQ